MESQLVVHPQTYVSERRNGILLGKDVSTCGFAFQDLDRFPVADAVLEQNLA